MKVKTIPLVTTIEEAKPHIERWGEEECSPMIILRLPNALRLLNADVLRNLPIQDHCISKLAQLSPLLIDLYIQAYSLEPAQADRFSHLVSIGPHIDHTATPPQMHVDLSEEARKARSCNIIGFERLDASRRRASIFIAAENLHLPGPIYEGPIQPGDVTFMNHCLHHFTIGKVESKGAEYMRLSQPDPGILRFNDCVI